MSYLSNNSAEIDQVILVFEWIVGRWGGRAALMLASLDWINEINRKTWLCVLCLRSFNSYAESIKNSSMQCFRIVHQFISNYIGGGHLRSASTGPFFAPKHWALGVPGPEIGAKGWFFHVWMWVSAKKGFRNKDICEKSSWCSSWCCGVTTTN